jgi:phenylalanyl-tRNA synthetase beta chain
LHRKNTQSLVKNATSCYKQHLILCVHFLPLLLIMRILLSWLRDYIDWTATADELADTLTRCGIEVESIERVGLDADDIIAARVLDVLPHPNADRLRVCVVYDGTAEHRVVCGASNVAVGQIVALTLPGATLPGGLVIRQRSIRGVESRGMICSAAELGVGDDHSGILVLDNGLEPGTAIKTLYPPDVVFDIGITPNRADALSHYGIARILAAAHGMRAQLPSITLAEQFDSMCVIDLPEPALCWRYAARVLDQVRILPSPHWLRLRLERVGLRPRNLVVDVTNYVMLECGHPLHAFDYDTVEQGHIIVRYASTNESHFVTLDGQERKLDTSMLCICDASKPLAIAGVMGGANSAITDSTQRVLIESAYFLPSSIRRTAKALGLQTDASYRFERGADIEMIPYALDRAAALIAELSGARVSTCVDNYPHRWSSSAVTIRLNRAERILGTRVEIEKATAYLERAGFSLLQNQQDQITVRVPSYRGDVTAEIDLIEEIALAIGYDSIAPSGQASIPFSARNVPQHLQLSEQRNQIRQYLASIGFHEALSYHLHAPEALRDSDAAIEIANALGRERSVLRQWLLPSMLEHLSRNARVGLHCIRLFELGKTFWRDHGANSTIREEEHLAIALAGQAVERHWLAQERAADIFDLKGVVEALLQSFGVQPNWHLDEQRALDQWLAQPVLALSVGGTLIGFLGQVHRHRAQSLDLPEATFVAELAVEPLYRSSQKVWHYQPPSPYPEVVRDIAIVVDEATSSGTIATVIADAGGALLRSVVPFDVFVHPSLGRGKKSIAYRLTFGSRERTLTDEEVSALVAKILESLARHFNAQLRST